MEVFFMDIVVQKYGGTSVADKEKLELVIKKILSAIKEENTSSKACSPSKISVKLYEVLIVIRQVVTSVMDHRIIR